ncbi:uncharacterized protein K452DRAFT_303485 [Aplosporella prunicola CBS 121167]|uniref:ubiquitinyl hydrolase 1 n=1 Tax=Aplosporella prunicola CBS 121167 TaxID=1176127 RepID=A0A6A6AVB0_9PEZI|nr:uncharacterized protein K452DRAFT_303485 [Aplosporella prunicola CBS 121167]KAF2135526.1 hypothetical protein K452DRAFT_303485 [Aplosporella prunicola CBS 121167]
MRPPGALLQAVINHVALPAQLPTHEDTDPGLVDHALIDRLITAALTLRNLSNGDSIQTWEDARFALATAKALNVNRKLEKSILLDEFRLLRKNILILHVTQQNAGLLIRRSGDTDESTIIVEAFEVSPPSEKVLAAEGALQWDFPGSVVAIPSAVFLDDSFQNQLAAFLEQASTESVKRFAAQAWKSGVSVFESRDTGDPALITQMLMTLLEAYGHRVSPPRLRKRIHDDVCFDKAGNPWRRSAYWLVLRVGLYRFLSTLHGGETGRVYYKFILCVALALLMNDAIGTINLDLLDFMKRKLSRRLAKLEVNKIHASAHTRPLYEAMFTMLDTLFKTTLGNANKRIEAEWAFLKKSIQRPVPRLLRNTPRNDTVLSLPCSIVYLQKVMAWQQHQNVVHHVPRYFDFARVTDATFHVFARRYFSLCELESVVKQSLSREPLSREDLYMRCEQLAEQIHQYLDAVGDSYDSDPEQKSTMLLIVMRLWMAMDRYAIDLFPLLAEFNPNVSPNSLDVLRLPHSVDLHHLMDLQQYLKRRWEDCDSTTRSIFDEPRKGCFAQRYYDSSDAATSLREIHAAIKKKAEIQAAEKRSEWEMKTEEYDELGRQIARLSCVYVLIDGERVHDRHCPKCILSKKADYMIIRVHEHPLPHNDDEAKAVIFELACPKAFSVYRNATWRILGVLARPKQPFSPEPLMMLQNYSELQAWSGRAVRHGVVLASIKKSFLQTHYGKPPRKYFPVPCEDVILKNGLELAYYDTATKSWPGSRSAKPTFAHHCQIEIPSNSPFSSLQSSPGFAVDSNGPSSYEVIASQTKCPSGLNTHEYMAYQNLLSGKHRRWLAILIELGSSNLNFSMEAPSSLVSHLALQAGPFHGIDPLRITHKVFKDPSFCDTLSGQINKRLDGVASNWRETNSMDMLITLILRFHSLADDTNVLQAGKLLEKARSITSQWIRQLRVEIWKSTDLTTSRRNSQYALSASLLCRRTFHLYSDMSQVTLQPGVLRLFIEASIALQDNLGGDPAAFSPGLKRALIRDLKATYSMRYLLLRSIKASPESLCSVIDDVWPLGQGADSRTYTPLHFHDEQDDHILITLHTEATQATKRQAVEYELLSGSLYIDGQKLGQLPAEHRESVMLVQLFGHQNLLTWPSRLPGMRYQLSHIVEGHEIHIGFRGDVLFVRACHMGSILEFIPAEKFGTKSYFDLPASLLNNCVHWLDVRTGTLEVRQRPKIWRHKRSNWILDVNTREAWRKNSILVDPHSQTFQKIARVFSRFEYPAELTVYQPQRFPLSVEIRRLELTFFVNRTCLLECKELRSEIDPNQDAGTWYGLNSKLVLRDTSNHKRRSIIVPMGSLTTVKNQFHVAVDVANEGTYARYIINDVLGRLECPAEPWLLYKKAQFHAYTSFMVPDPLTGRTGSEEALDALSSGLYQPWTPLSVGPLQCILSIAKLAPKRVYYPKDSKFMQQVHWDPDLTIAIQHEGFRFLAEQIYQKNETLSLFASGKAELPVLEPAGNRHLLQRGYAKRVLYERSGYSRTEQQGAAETVYISRDAPKTSKMRQNVFESTLLLRQWPSRIFSTQDLAGVLQSWPTIGGYDRVFDKVLISDRLNVNFGLEWGALVRLCLEATSKDLHRLAFLFAMLSFWDDANMDVIRTLIAFAVLDQLKCLDPPQWASYSHFRFNHVPTVDYITQLIKPCAVPYPGDERDELLSIGFKLRKRLEKAQLLHEGQTEADCNTMAILLVSQWPCHSPTLTGPSEPLLIDVEQAMTIVRPEWQRLFENIEQSRYIEQVQRVLDRCHCDMETVQPDNRPTGEEVLYTGFHFNVIPSVLGELMRKAGPAAFPTVASPSNSANGLRSIAGNVLALRPVNTERGVTPTVSLAKAPVINTRTSREANELRQIITGITKSKSHVQQQYARDLLQSLEAFESIQGEQSHFAQSVPRITPASTLTTSQKFVQSQLMLIQTALKAGDLRAKWLCEGGLWPCTSPIALLEQLRSNSDTVFGTHMKESLVNFALSITQLQHLLRIEDATVKNNQQRLREEERNAGHQNWSPFDRTDWILLEIDADILLRPEQVDVAIATLEPSSGSNSVLQMNMGQGKTSCIMPMVAAVLADSKQLVRVIVPKALLLQTAQILQSRLGGLLGREVKHVPFSRKTPTNENTIKAFFGIHDSVRKSSGVMVALPEHVMSFMLSGAQRLLDVRIPEAKQMVNVQGWMRKVCRDVLDECDFTLAVRTQLIYPSGPQSAVDGHPQRWETAEALLHMVYSHLWNLEEKFPRSIEVFRRPQGGFPFVFFLRNDVEEALIRRIVDDIIHDRTSIIPMMDCTQTERNAIRNFITQGRVSQTVADRIEQLFPDKPIAKQNLYLLRGLLVHRILLLALKKRWNVQYGLHPARDPIAVPYHAKGVPSEQAEWGHPDVSILFTCLSFYFGGLAPLQLRQCLEHVDKSDDPFGEYDRWTHACSSLPDVMRDWNVINSDDELQLAELWKYLRYEVIVVDYFLNHFVFPRHAKQFNLKIQASGWDIPLLPLSPPDGKAQSSVRKYKPLTTGFSGTNDNRTMLPLTIKQQDLPGLSHTNAEVLTYLLQPRSRHYVLAADERGRRLSETALLWKLFNMKIRILIDAGAQILEMENRDLAREWLLIDHEASAAVYFDAANKPYVLYRNNSQVPLLASPFANDLEGCVVYLDEAHTRGTDLKMPASACGALTLGLGQTKDHTVQAAMRLRQLATTQSIKFFAPPEVHQSILDLRKKTTVDWIDSSDVVYWLLEQTCNGIEQLQPLYYSQGVDFCHRSQAGIDNPDILMDAEQRKAYVKAVRQKEHQTLEQLYSGKASKASKPTTKSGDYSQGISAYMKELNQRRKRFQDFGNAVHGSALQEVEQEREVAYEVESVREVQKPVHYRPLSFSGLHKDISIFIRTGRLPAGYSSVEDVFAALRRTHLGIKFGINSGASESKFFVSREFSQTVQLQRPNDDFMRQVNWILWSKIAETAIVVSPEEAEEVLAILGELGKSGVHLITYAAPVTRRMLHFNDLKFYATPPLPTNWQCPEWLRVELGIFAGRLYYEFHEHEALVKFLGCGKDDKEVSMNGTNDTSGTVDGEEISQIAAQSDAHGGHGSPQSFTEKPLTFLQEWLAVRRKGQDFTHTPMGHVCQGKSLVASHPFFSQARPEESSKINAAPTLAGMIRQTPAAAEDSDPDTDFDDDFLDAEEGLDEEDFLDAEEELSDLDDRDRDEVLAREPEEESDGSEESY